MYIIGALADKLLKSKEFSGQIESIIEIHVLPEYTSPVPYLRERVRSHFFLKKKQYTKMR